MPTAVLLKYDTYETILHLCSLALESAIGNIIVALYGTYIDW